MKMFTSIPGVCDTYDTILEELANLPDVEMDDTEVVPQSFDEPDDGWVNLSFCVPEATVTNIEAEIKRIGAILDLKPNLSSEVKRGLALELICANSALTPIESLV